MGNRSCFAPTEPVRIMADDGVQWIEIKPKMNYADRNYLLDVLVQMGALTGASDTAIQAKVGAFQMALLERSITNWNLQAPKLDEHGREVLDGNNETIDGAHADHARQYRRPRPGR